MYVYTYGYDTHISYQYDVLVRCASRVATTRTLVARIADRDLVLMLV